MTPSCGMFPGDSGRKCVCACACVVLVPEVCKKGFIMLYKMASLSECYSETCCYAHDALVAIAKARLSAAATKATDGLFGAIQPNVSYQRLLLLLFSAVLLYVMAGLG